MMTWQIDADMLLVDWTKFYRRLHVLTTAMSAN